MRTHKKLPKLDLNITNRCNFHCTHCAFDSGAKKMAELSLEQITKILTETKELGGERFDITGGEPLVRKDVGEIIKIGKDLGYKIELITNGSLLTKKKLLEFKRLGLDSLAISLDGSDYETYSRIRQISKKTYEKVLKSIDDALSIGFVVKINTVAFQSNMEDIPNLTQFCIDKGVKEHGLYYFTPVGRGDYSKEKSISPLIWLDFIRKNLMSFDKKIKISLEIPLIEKHRLKREIDCIADTERYHLQILPDGKVYPCVILASYEKPIANLTLTSVKEVWNNEKLWKKYWKSIAELFVSYNSYCVNFKQAFDMRDYDLKKYDFACPLRKFSPEDVL